MHRRSRDDGRSLASFIDRIDVACPRCGRHAVIAPRERQGPGAIAKFPARLACGHCGLVRTQQLGPGVLWSYALRTDGRDPYFRLPLWLQEPTRHGLVIAYNARHLEALETFVSAELRERNSDPAMRWHNRTMASRLPRWMKSAANRHDILKALQRLRTRLQDT